MLSNKTMKCNSVSSRRKQAYGRDAPASLLQPIVKQEDALQGYKEEDLLKEDDLEDCLD